MDCWRPRDTRNRQSVWPESTLLWVAATPLVSTVAVWRVRHLRPAHVVDSERLDDEPSEGGLHESFPRFTPFAVPDVDRVGYLAGGVRHDGRGLQFKAIAKANIPATDELAMFFGSFNMLAGLIALILQVLFTSRILRQAGIGVTLFIVPVAMTISSGVLLVFGLLFAAGAPATAIRFCAIRSTKPLLSFIFRHRPRPRFA